MKSYSKFAKYCAMSVMFAGMAGYLSSCGFFGSSETKYDYIPVKESKNDKWGMLSPDGEFLFLDEFENTPTVVSEGFFAVKEGEDGLISVYKADKKPQILKGCEGLKDAGLMVEGMMPIVRKNERITVINESGKTLFEIKPYKGTEIAEASGHFSDGMLLVRTENDKYGFINTKGDFVIKPEYDRALEFSNGLTVVADNDSTSNQGYTWYIINKKGEKLFRAKEGMDMHGRFGDLFVVRQGDRCRILNSKGEEKVKCPSKVKLISDIKGDKYIFYSGDGFGVMDMEDNVIIRAKYESIEAYDDNTFFCQKENGKGYDIIDGKGEITNTVDVKQISIIPEFGIIGGDDDDLYVMNKKGEKIGKNSFYCYRTLTPDSVESDYFDSEAVANKVVDLFDGLSKDGIKIGATAPSIKLLSSKNINDLSTYSSDYSWELADEKNYRVKASMLFSEYYKQYDYDYDYYNYTWRERSYLNPSAKLYALVLDVKIYKDDHQSDVGNAIVDIFKKQGMNIEAQNKKGAVLTKGNTIYAVTWADKDNVGIMCLEKTDSNLSYFKEYINSLSDDSEVVEVAMPDYASDSEVVAAEVVEETCVVGY